ncbi:hypothetical protein PAMP_002761 [Pampus punctatissimus]
MAHKCYDNNRSALPVEDKGSSVIPIPARELQEICVGPETAAKIRPPFGPGGVLSMMRHTELESHPVAAEEPHGPFLTFKKNNFPPQTTPIALSEKEKEIVSNLPGTTAITEAEVRGEDSCTTYTEMESERDTKPKGPILVPGGRRNGHRRRKRAAAKYWKYKDVCPKLLNIYEPDDTRLYHGNHTQPFPECTEVLPPYSKSCCVCYDKSVITIICTGDVGSLEVEGSGGAHIVNTTVFFFVVVAMLLVTYFVRGQIKKETAFPGAIQSPSDNII